MAKIMSKNNRSPHKKQATLDHFHSFTKEFYKASLYDSRVGSNTIGYLHICVYEVKLAKCIRLDVLYNNAHVCLLWKHFTLKTLDDKFRQLSF